MCSINGTYSHIVCASPDKIGDSQVEVWLPYKNPRHGQGLRSSPELAKLTSFPRVPSGRGRPPSPILQNFLLRFAPAVKPTRGTRGCKLPGAQGREGMERRMGLAFTLTCTLIAPGLSRGACGDTPGFVPPLAAPNCSFSPPRSQFTTRPASSAAGRKRNQSAAFTSEKCPRRPKLKPRPPLGVRFDPPPRWPWSGD